MRPPYQDLTLSASGTASLTISHRSWWHTLLSALASACRKTIKLSGWYATTKSSPSRLIDTCLRKSALFRNASTASSTDTTPPPHTHKAAPKLSYQRRSPLASFRDRPGAAGKRRGVKWRIEHLFVKRRTFEISGVRLSECHFMERCTTAIARSKDSLFFCGAEMTLLAPRRHFSAAQHSVAFGWIVLQKSNVAAPRIFRENKMRETITDSYTLNRAAEVAGEFNARGSLPSRLYTKIASAARRIFEHQCKTTFATLSGAKRT